MPAGIQDETAQRGGCAECSSSCMMNVFLTRCDRTVGMSTISTSASVPTTDVTLTGPMDAAGKGMTGMFPDCHCFRVSPSLSAGSTIGQDRSGWERSTAVVTKRTTDERSWCRSSAESSRERCACALLYCRDGGALIGPWSTDFDLLGS